MPLYEYQCDTCGHRFEVIQKFSDAPLDRCPKCGGVVQKLQSAPAFQFKGSGWYITDYARKGQPAREGGGGEKPKASKDASKETGAAGAPDSKSASSDSKSSAPDSGSASSNGSASSTSSTATKPTANSSKPS